VGFTKIQPIPEPAEMLARVPLSPEMQKVKERRDWELRDIVTGQNSKFLVIIGPCSADDEDSVCRYAEKLANLYEKVKERLFLVPRI